MELYSQHGFWYAFCRVYDPTTDKFKRKKRTTGIRDDGTRSAKERAELVAAQIEKSFALGRVGPTGPTLQKIFEDLVEAREVAKQKSWKRTLDTAKHFFQFFGPDTAAASIGTAELVKYAASRMATTVPGRKTKASPGAVRREFAEFTRARNLAKLPAVEIPALPKYVPRERWLTADECKRLYEAAPLHRRDHLMVYLQSGLRFSEAYRVERVGNNNLRVRGTKTEGADRTVPLTDLAKDALRQGLTWWPHANRELKRYCRNAGIAPCSFNDLRRTFATHLAIAGVPILHVMHLMGHKSTRMLEQVYARVEKGEHLHAAVAKLPSWTTAGHELPLRSLKSNSRDTTRSDNPE